MTAIALLVLGGAGWYFTTAEERMRLRLAVLVHARRLHAMVDRHRHEPEPLRDALRARAPIPFVTVGLVAINVLAFAYVIMGGATLSDPEGLVAWGGNFGPRTANGEWWRLISAAFLHTSVLQLLINVAALAQTGVTLERLVGRPALATVYLVAAINGGLLNLSLQPMTVSVGASSAVFSLYGLLVASAIWIVRRRGDITLSWPAVQPFLPIAGLFVLYHLATGDLGTAAVRAGLVLGLVSGAVLARGAIDQQPPALRAAAVAGCGLAIAVVAAISLKGIADVRPEMRRLVAIEDRTVHEYDAAANQFRLGAIKAKVLAQLIDKTILPELRQAHERIRALTGVPREHQPLVARADEYLRLRDESWSLRSEALHKASMVTLRKADLAERASLDAFEKIKVIDQN
jgi:membrane associated rhomboid family serine protease